MRYCIDFSLLGVYDARWYPLYDLYASSQDGKPSTSAFLHYRVNLSQGTGEDWNNAKLILSTSETDVLNAGVPESDSFIIEPKQPPLPPPIMLRRAIPTARARGAKRRERDRERARDRSVGEEEEISDTEAEADEDEDDEYDELGFDSTDLLDAVLPEMSEGGAAVAKTPMGVNYTVDELTTVRSDAESHKVLVAIVPLEVATSHITTPRKSPLAYLQVCSLPTLHYCHTYRAGGYSAR